MKFFADENIDPRLIALLRGAGHEVLRTANTGASDDQAVAEAAAGACILLTEDSDFGRLVFLNHRFTAGVVFLRLDDLSRDAANRRAFEAIQDGRETRRFHCSLQGANHGR